MSYILWVVRSYFKPHRPIQYLKGVSHNRFDNFNLGLILEMPSVGVPSSLQLDPQPLQEKERLYVRTKKVFARIHFFKCVFILKNRWWKGRMAREHVKRMKRKAVIIITLSDMVFSVAPTPRVSRYGTYSSKSLLSFSFKLTYLEPRDKKKKPWSISGKGLSGEINWPEILKIQENRGIKVWPRSCG